MRETMALLLERGAAGVQHPGGDLYSHLQRTGDRLERWGAAADLVLAGRWHAAYGTDDFGDALFTIDERDAVREAIGEEAEAIVYRYASCDRRFVYPQIALTPCPIQFRDRFTGAVTLADGAQVRTFAELTVANELDVLEHAEELRRVHGATLAALFTSWAPLLSGSARRDVGVFAATLTAVGATDAVEHADDEARSDTTPVRAEGA